MIMEKGFAILAILTVFVIGGITGLYIQDEHNVVNAEPDEEVVTQ